MNLEHAANRARNVHGPKAAAKLYADIEYELAMGEPDSDQETAGEAALALLEERFPDVREQSSDVVENGHVPNMSRRGWENAAGGQTRTTRPPRRPSEHPPPASSGGRRAAHAAGRAASSALSSGPVTSATDTAMGGLRILLLLGLGYLLLSPRGSSAFQAILNTAGNIVRTIVDPVDPFGSSARAPAAAAAPAARSVVATGPRGSQVRQPAHPTQLTTAGGH